MIIEGSLREGQTVKVDHVPERGLTFETSPAGSDEKSERTVLT